MYGRVNIIFGEEDKVENGVAHLEESDRAAVEETSGNQGLTTLVDREAGVIVAVSYWDALTHSSEAALTRAREGAAAAAGGDLIVESYEVVLQERMTAPATGAVVRLWRVQIEPARVADGLSFVCDEVMPQMRASAGFCTAELMIDRRTGNGLLLTTWTREDEAARSDAVVNQSGDVAVERAGTKVTRTETYELVRTSAQPV